MERARRTLRFSVESRLSRPLAWALLPGLLDLVGDGGDLAPDEGDAPEVPDEPARLLDRYAGRRRRCPRLAEVPHLAPDEQREHDPENDPDDGDDVEEADRAHACGRKRKSHAPSLPRSDRGVSPARAREQAG